MSQGLLRTQDCSAIAVTDASDPGLGVGHTPDPSSDWTAMTPPSVTSSIAHHSPKLGLACWLLSILLAACESAPRAAHIASPVAAPNTPAATGPVQPHQVRLSSRVQEYLAKLCAPEPEASMSPVSEAPPDEYWSFNYVPKARSADACEVSQDHLAQAEDEILGTPLPAKQVPLSAWDHRSKPRYQDRIRERLGLPEPAQAWLIKNGFAVLGDNALDSYATAYHDIHQRELPVFVTKDSIFHALFASMDTLLAKLESDSLAPELHRFLVALQCGLPAAAADYPEEVAADLDLYIAVGRRLLSPHGETQLVLNDSAPLDKLITLAENAEGLHAIELFGRERMVDFSQYAPRGHYATNDRGYLAAPAQGLLDNYFRAAMWLSRLELNIVSRSSRSSHPDVAPDPRETPREAVLGLALADLVQRTGQLQRIGRLERAFALMGGRREDLGVKDLLALRAKAGISDLRAPDTADRLKHAIGSGFRRTARLHFMPQNSPELPVISTLLGPRVPADVAVLRDLVHDELPNRYLVGAGDIAVLLGHAAGRDLLSTEIARFPELLPKLERGKQRMFEDATAPAHHEDSAALYHAWLGAVLAIARRAPGVTPSFTGTKSYSYLDMNSALVAFGQARHNFVLAVGQGYDAYGCDIPDGYVEPALETYRALKDYVETSSQAFGLLDPQDASGARAYFHRVSQVLAVLIRIASHQLAGVPLTKAQQRWLAMVAEHVPEYSTDSGGPPKYTGWYFDLFFARDRDSKSTGAFVADYYTSTNLGQVAYLGASRPRLGLFVVDAGGAPRLMVGPVARGYEHVGTVEKRLDDHAAEAQGVGSSPWEHRYTVPPTPVPEVTVTVEPQYARSRTSEFAQNPYLSFTRPRNPDAVVLKLESPVRLGEITVELVGHHGEPLAIQQVRVGPEPTALTLRPPRDSHGQPLATEGIRLRIGTFVYTQGASAYRPLQSFSLPDLPPEDYAP